MDITMSNGWRVQLVVRSNTSNLYLYNADGMVVLAKQYPYWQHQRGIDEASALVALGMAHAKRARRAA